MIGELGGPRKRIDEQIVELSIKAGEGLLVELKVKGSITELISRLLVKTSSEKCLIRRCALHSWCPGFDLSCSRLGRVSDFVSLEFFNAFFFNVSRFLV